MVITTCLYFLVLACYPMFVKLFKIVLRQVYNKSNVNFL